MPLRRNSLETFEDRRRSRHPRNRGLRTKAVLHFRASRMPGVGTLTLLRRVSGSEASSKRGWSASKPVPSMPGLSPYETLWNPLKLLGFKAYTASTRRGASRAHGALQLQALAQGKEL